MFKHTGELIIRITINLCCRPISSYILSLVIARNVRFFQNLSHIARSMDDMSDTMSSQGVFFPGM